MQFIRVGHQLKTEEESKTYFNSVYFSIFLNLDSFNSLMMQIVDNEFPVREIPIFFNHAIKLQVNEIDFDKHLKLIFPEFLEAFSRVIDKLSPIPFGDKIENWTAQSRQEQHLSTKIENVIPILMKLITNPEFKSVKEKFPFLSRDEESGLIIYDNTHPLYSNRALARRNTSNINQILIIFRKSFYDEKVINPFLMKIIDTDNR